MERDEGSSERRRDAKRRVGVTLLLVGMLAGVAATAHAQGWIDPQRQLPQASISPTEIQRLFVACVVMQAQRGTGCQTTMPWFLARVKALPGGATERRRTRPHSAGTPSAQQCAVARRGAGADATEGAR